VTQWENSSNSHCNLLKYLGDDCTLYRKFVKVMTGEKKTFSHEVHFSISKYIFPGQQGISAHEVLCCNTSR
jgi:hypothetical protein